MLCSDKRTRDGVCQPPFKQPPRPHCPHCRRYVPALIIPAPRLSLPPTDPFFFVESIDHQQTIKGTDNFEADFDSLAQYLKPDEPRYIIYRASNSGEDPALVFILFVPDVAKVRSKMLYASSATSLQRQLLGATAASSSALDTIYWSELAEVSRRGWKEHLAHEALAAPLTQEEQSLRSVREKEAHQMLGTGARRSHVGGAAGATVAAATAESADAAQLGMKFAPDAEEALRDLAASSVGGTVVLKIDLATETVYVDSAGSGALDAAQFATDAAQYTVHKPAGADAAALFYTCPSGTKVKERMVYATNFKSIKLHATAALGSLGGGVYEGSDGADVVEEYEEDLKKRAAPSSSSSSASGTPRFSRPKAPGRRRAPGA